MTINTVRQNPEMVRTIKRDQTGTVTRTAADRKKRTRRSTESKMATYPVRFGLPAQRK